MNRTAQIKSLKKLKGVFLTFLFAFIMPFFCFWLIHNISSFSLNNTLFCQGYTINGIDVSGLNRYQAQDKLNSFLIKENEINLEIIYQDKKWTFTSQDFEITTNIHTILDKAYESNRKGGLINKLKILKKIKNMGFSSEIALNYVFIGMDEKLENIISQIEKPAIDSSVSFNTIKNVFEFTTGVQGISVDKEKLYKDILNGLKTERDLKVFVKTSMLSPQVTKEKLKKATKKQSSFSTFFTSSNYDRKNNIKLSTKTLNGHMIKPRETFSFNQTIGRRSLEKGYKQANIIKDGEFIKGVGGGVCQVSTTLYNALILSGIEISEVHKHSLPISYVKPALDAMVSWSTADLKFTNTTDFPIFIIGKCNNNALTFEIYGDTKKENVEIRAVSEIIRKIPHNGDKIVLDKKGEFSDKIMFRGEFYRLKSPKDGYEAQAFLEYFIDGQFSHRKQIRHCLYEAQQGLVYEGADKLPEGMTLPDELYP